MTQLIRQNITHIAPLPRIDYLTRCYKKGKDSLSRDFRTLYKNKSHRASLEEDILEIWKKHFPTVQSLISELIGAFKRPFVVGDLSPRPVPFVVGDLSPRPDHLLRTDISQTFLLNLMALSLHVQ
jgi:hypothetical protein